MIYGVTVAPDGGVHVRMTLTAPSCPAAEELPAEVEDKVRGVLGVTDARVETVFDPPWDSGKMSEAARLKLGLLRRRLPAVAHRRPDVRNGLCAAYRKGADSTPAGAQR